MKNVYALHHLVEGGAERAPSALALKCRNRSVSYEQLSALVAQVGGALAEWGLERSARVGIYSSKSIEWVAAAFGATRAGCAFVPINPALKAPQVSHILRDCDVQVLITSPERFLLLRGALRECSALQRVVLLAESIDRREEAAGLSLCTWKEFVAAPPAAEARVSERDIAGIFYTSGSTGKPKGVVFSHRNLVSGAASVSSYLENCAQDRLLAVLPLSFDAGFSQLTTAFHVAASAVLLDYTLPGEVVRTLAGESITGLTAVPPLWIHLAGEEWPATIDGHLRYFASTGGKMPRDLLARLRARVPSAKPFLMYGLTEAFRSTYLPPDEVERRPDSIGKAIPNQEVLVLRSDGSRCGPDEPGELVHRGSTVALGYWNDLKRTAERFRPLPNRPSGLVLEELAVFSGDIVRMDQEGFLYFVGRNDEMIKSSGYRISPVEIEEAIYSTGLVAEAVATGIPDERLGHRIAAAVVPKEPTQFSPDALLRALQKTLPAFMVPHRVETRSGNLPRTGNGKLDRALLSRELARVHSEGTHEG